MEPKLDVGPALSLRTEGSRAREKMKTRRSATFKAVQWMVSGGPGAAGEAVTDLVEEDQNTNEETVLRPEMEAIHVWDRVK